MNYTVKKLAELSGVSVRTLHFYDEIGLLKPAYVGNNHYRYYEEEQLLMLQQILFYRELGFPLNEIQRIVSSDSFDKIKALQSHKQTLQHSLDHTQELIKTIDKTLSHLRGEIKMQDKEFFDHINPRESKIQKQYEKHLVDRGILSEKELDESWEKVKYWDKSKWENFQNEGNAIYSEMVVMMENKLSPSSEKVQELMRKHYQLIKPFWTFNKETYVGLAQLYCEHPDFRKFFDLFHPKLIEFFVEAMKIFAERELS